MLYCMLLYLKAVTVFFLSVRKKNEFELMFTLIDRFCLAATSTTLLQISVKNGHILTVTCCSPSWELELRPLGVATGERPQRDSV